MKIMGPVYEGIHDSIVLAYALIEAVVGGCFRVFGRILRAFVEHKPLPVAPGKTRQIV